MNIDNKKIRIGFSTITIKKQAHQFKKDNLGDAYGQFMARENKIEIQPDLSDVDEANTLLHEILHAGVWVTSLCQVGQPLEQSKDEELVINSLSNNLIQVFIDNKLLLH
jgi:hypothetical protein